MNIFDELTGNAFEDEVAQYREVYKEILLGVHRDMETLRKRVHESGSRCGGSMQGQV